MSQIDWIALDVLEFDSKNPRLPRSVDGSSQDAILNWLVRDAAIVPLMESIATQGYFAGEPLIVTPENASEEGHFRVVEGNRRLAAAALLAHPGRATTHQVSINRAAASQTRPVIDSLPVVSFPTHDETLDYLGYRHLTGVKEWKPAEKARYLKLLFSREPQDDPNALSRIASKVGSSASAVRKLLEALHVFEQAEIASFFGLPGVDSTVDFAVLSTALSFVNINAFIRGGSGATATEVQGPQLNELFDWLYTKDSDGKTRIGESRNLRKLAAIVTKPRALELFRAGSSLDDALKETPYARDELLRALIRALDAVHDAQDYLEQASTVGKIELGQADQLRNAARALLASVETRMVPDDGEED